MVERSFQTRCGCGVIVFRRIFGAHVKHEEEENFVLDGKGGKTKGKKGVGGAESNSKGKKEKKDLSKIKCFHFHQFRHYATKCPQRKKGYKKDQVAASAEVDEFSSKFETEFSLIDGIIGMANSVANSVWYNDSGASNHMTRNKDILAS